MSDPTVFIRVDPVSNVADERVYHNESCPKLGQRNLPADACKSVPKPPEGYRACKTCGG
jgi:hypothetical protein